MSYFNVIINIAGPISIYLDKCDRSSFIDPKIPGKVPNLLQHLNLFPLLSLACVFLIWVISLS